MQNVVASKMMAYLERIGGKDMVQATMIRPRHLSSLSRVNEAFP